MIPHYYEKKNGIYVLQVEPTREYRIRKINSSKWEWSEWTFVGNTMSMTVSGIKSKFKDCVFAAEMDNQFKPRAVGYPPRNPWKEKHHDKDIKPITPDKLKPSTSLPSAVLDAFNLLISANYRNGASRVLQKDVVTRLTQDGFSRERIFKDKLLDVEEVYREAGWEVEYDKPAYDESYEPYFVFRKKPNG